jgi:putative intracellular protease/amidase
MRGVIVIAARSNARHTAAVRQRNGKKPSNGNGRHCQQATRRIALVAFPGAQILDVTGPIEVFARTTRWLADHGRYPDPAYTTELLASAPGAMETSSGLRLTVDRTLNQVRGPATAIDTLLVAGGIGTRAAMQDHVLLR